MKLFRIEYFANEAGQTVKVVTPLQLPSHPDNPIALGQPEFHVDYQVPVTITDPSGRPIAQEIVGVPVTLEGATLAEAFADIPNGWEIATKRAQEIVLAKMEAAKKKADAAARSIVIPGQNGHNPASRIRGLAGQ